MTHKYDWINVPRDITRLLTAEMPLTTKIPYMEAAIEFALKSRLRPTVGAVLVRGDEIVGKGYRDVEFEEGEGTPGITYAEYMAIRESGDKTIGATLYTTLEPSIVLGNPSWIIYPQEIPTADLIIQSGISRVVVGLFDMDKRNQGQGIKKLVANGIKVEAGYLGLEEQLYDLIGDGRFLIRQGK